MWKVECKVQNAERKSSREKAGSDLGRMRVNPRIANSRQCTKTRTGAHREDRGLTTDCTSGTDGKRRKRCKNDLGRMRVNPRISRIHANVRRQEHEHTEVTEIEKDCWPAKYAK